MLNLKLPGQLIAVYDEKMALDAFHHGCTVIVVDDPVGMARLQNLFISGAVFIPRVEAMQMLVNGDKNGFFHSYNQQLYSDPVIHEFLDTVVCALYQGKTVIFYIPEVAFGFAYHEILFQFIQNVYGLHIQKDGKMQYFQEFGFMPTIDALFNFNQINGVVYLAAIPDQKLDDPEFIRTRLCPMFGLEYNNETIKYLRDWKSAINAANRPIRPLITFKNGSK